MPDAIDAAQFPHFAEAMSTASAKPDSDPYTTAVQQSIGDQTTEVRNSLLNAQGANPTEEGKLQQLSAQTGIPVDSIRSNKAEVQASAAMSGFNADELIKQFPHTAAFLAVPENALVAGQDVHATAALEQAVKALPAAALGQSGPNLSGEPRQRVSGNALKNLQGTIHLLGTAERTLAQTGAHLGEKAGLAAAALAGPYDLLRSVFDGTFRETFNKLDSRQATPTQEQIFADIVAPYTASIKALSLPENATIPEKLASATGGLAGMAIETMAVGGGAPIFAGAKGITQTIMNMLGHGVSAAQLPVLMQSLETMKQVYEQTGDMNQAIKSAIGSHEAGTLSMMLPLSPAGKFLPRAAGNAIAFPAGSEVGRQLSNLTMPGAMQQPRASVEDTGIQSFMGIVMAGIPVPRAFNSQHPAVRQTYVDAAKAAKAETDLNALHSVAAMAQNATLRENNPAAFKQFIQTMTDEGKLSDVYISAKALDAAIKGNEVDANALAQKVPDLINRLAEARQIDGDVQIPVADFMTHITGTKIGDALMPELKASADGMTYSQGQEHYKNQVADMEKVATDLLTERVKTEAQKVAVDTVYQDVLGQLNETKHFTPDVNKVYAKLTAAGYAARADAMGMDVGELYKQHPLDINSTLMNVEGQRTPLDVAQKIPSSAMIDVGLATNDGAGITEAQVRAELDKLGIQVIESGTHQSGTEPTFAARLSRPLTPEEAHQFSVDLKQEAVAQVVGGQGELYGPQAENWKPFNPDYFLTPEGGKLEKPLAQSAPQTAREKQLGYIKQDLESRLTDAFYEVDRYGGKYADGGLPTSDILSHLSSFNRSDAYMKDVFKAAFKGKKTITKEEGLALAIDAAKGQELMAGQYANLGEYKLLGTPSGKVVTTDGFKDFDGKMPTMLVAVADGVLPSDALKAAMLQAKAKHSDLLFVTGRTENERARSFKDASSAQLFDEVQSVAKQAGLAPELTSFTIDTRGALRTALQQSPTAKFAPPGMTPESVSKSKAGDQKDVLRATAYQIKADKITDASIATISKAFTSPAPLSQSALKPGEVNLDAVHFSKVPRESLSGRAYGTGIRGAEAKRLAESSDSRIKNRVSFYVDEGKGVFPEGGVGRVAHDVSLTNMYDAAKNPLKFPTTDGNAFESAVLDAGFSGYYAKGAFGRQGAAVVMGDAAKTIKATPRTEALHQAWNVGLPHDVQNYYLAEAKKINEITKPLMRIRDMGTVAHEISVSEVAGHLAENMGLTTKGVAQIKLAGFMHDASKSDKAIHDAINSGKALTSEERTLVNTHAAKAGEMASLANIDPEVIAIAVGHHTYGKTLTADAVVQRSIHILTGADQLASLLGGKGHDYPLYDSKGVPLDRTQENIYKVLKEKVDKGFIDPEVGKQVIDLLETEQLPGRLKEQWRSLPVSTTKIALNDKGQPVSNAFMSEIQRIEKASGEHSDVARELYSMGFRAGADGRIHKAGAGSAAYAQGLAKDPNILHQAARVAFYSQLHDTFAAAPDKVFGKAENVKNWLAANAAKNQVKVDEIYWSGVNDWLDTQAKVGKQEVLDYLDKGGVKIEETTLQAVEKSLEDWKVMRPDGQVDGHYATEAQAQVRADKIGGTVEQGEMIQVVKDPKFSTWVLPGGENYKELLLTLPEITKSSLKPEDFNIIKEGGRYSVYRKGSDKSAAWVATKKQAEDFITGEVSRKTSYENGLNNFKSQHFDQPNILAHIRTNERTDAEGNKVLFVEEIQSDWGQKGKKEGFLTPDDRAKPFKWDEATSEYVTTTKDKAEKWGMDGAWWATEDLANREMARGWTTKVPSAPFVTDTKSWTALALKKVIAYATDNGFDRVAWTTGEQQADRYSLAKQIDTLKWAHNKDGTYDIEANPDTSESVIKKNLSASALEDTIGKEAAQKVVDGVGTFAEKMQTPEQLRGRLSNLDLKVGGEGMKGYYDGILPQVANDLLKKVGGGKVADVGIGDPEAARYSVVLPNGKEVHTSDSLANAHAVPKDFEGAKVVMNPTATQQPGFTITPEMRANLQTKGLPLFQEEPIRATYSPDLNALTLLHKADLSSYVHELGHHFLELTTDLASRPNAPAMIRDDMSTILKWFGVNDLNTWQGLTAEQRVPFHEQFAESFERYLLEGKAPTIELQPVFSRIRSWMLRVYQDLQGMLSQRPAAEQLTPEVRQVFDRMLASQEAIAQAEHSRGYKPLFDSAELAGVKPDLYASYLKAGQDSTEQAVADMSTKSMKDMQLLSNAKGRMLKAMQKESDTKRDEIRAEVETELDAQPVYAAERYLRTGELAGLDGEVITTPKEELAAIKLNSDILKKDFTAAWVDKIRPLMSPQGVDPAIAAEHFGFESTEQFIRALALMKPRQSVVDGLTDQRMLERYGELSDAQAIDRAANKAIANYAREKFVATGLKILTKSPMPVREIIRAARESAANIIGQKKIGDLRPLQYEAQEARQHKEALKLAAKDPLGAARAERAALLNHELGKEAQQAATEAEKLAGYGKRLATKAAQKNMRGEFLDQMNSLLGRFDLRTSVGNPAADRKPLGEWLASESDRLSAVMPDIPGWILNDGFRVHYSEMTVEQMRGLKDSIKQLEHMARREQSQYMALRAMEFAQERGEVLGAIQKSWPQAFGSDGAPNDMEPNFVPSLKLAASRLGDKFAGEFLSPETILTILGGGKFSVVNESLFSRMSARSDWKATRLEGLYQELKPLFDVYNFQEKHDYARKDISTEAGIDTPLTRENALVVALLHGSADGQERLKNYGWTEAKQQAIVNLLDKRDVALANGIWKMFDENLWPELEALNKRTRGKAPPKIEALPATVHLGLMDEAVLTGGYFRLKYDTALDERAHHFDESQGVKDLLGGGMGMSAKTNQGSSTERKQGVVMRPRLDLGVFAETVNESVHDLAYREAVADTMRMLNDKGITLAVKHVVGVEGYRALVARVREVAAPPRSPSGFVEASLSLIRKNTVVNLMSGVKTALQNFTGLAPAFAEFHKGTLGMGVLTSEIAKFYSPKMIERYDFVMQHSEYMSNRFTSYDRDLQNAASKLTVNGSILPETSTFLGLMGLIDKGVSVPVWNAAFKEGMAKFNSDVDKSMQFADHTVRQTQGSGREVDLPQLLAGRGGYGQLKRVFTMFHSYFNGQLNLLVKHGVISKIEARDNPQQAVLNFTGKFIAIMAVPTVLTEMLMNGAVQEDETPGHLAGRYAGAFVRYGAGFFPIVRDMVPAIWTTLTGEGHYYGVKASPINSAYEGVVKGVGSVRDVAVGEGDKKDAKNIIMATGYTFGLPGKLVADTTAGTQAWLEGSSGPEAILLGPPRKP